MPVPSIASSTLATTATAAAVAIATVAATAFDVSAWSDRIVSIE